MSIASMAKTKHHYQSTDNPDDHFAKESFAARTHSKLPFRRQRRSETRPVERKRENTAVAPVQNKIFLLSIVV
ncbi:MAG: hypothetical protein ACLRSW_11565 [Christensenellaceae bacterium]